MPAASSPAPDIPETTRRRDLAPDSPEAMQLRGEAAAKKAEHDNAMKQKFLKKLERRAMAEWTVRWGAAVVMMVCMTAFLTLLVAMGLCQQFNMAMSCEHEFQTAQRLPVLAITVGVILCGPMFLAHRSSCSLRVVF